MMIKVNDKDISAYFLDGRIKFDRPEGAIGHSEAVLDFYGNEAVTVSRGETVEITTANNTLYFIVEKITETKDSSKKRIVARDAIYFKKDMPLPAAVFMNDRLSTVCQWLSDQAGFAVRIVPELYEDPVIPFYFIEEDTKLSEILREIAESVQGRVFSDVTDTETKGGLIRFQFASLKEYSAEPLMHLTADQISAHEISDLPRQYNYFTLKFKRKTQILDSLVFRGASYEDVFYVEKPGYPKSSDTTYYVEFENPVVKVTDHSFDARQVVIDQETWRKNIVAEDGGDLNYGALRDPFKMEMKFLCDDEFGGEIYDFRIYGTAIKQDEMSETIDVSGNDFKRSKEFSSSIISTDSDWHKKTLAWLAAEKAEKHKFTVVDSTISFVDLLNMNLKISDNDNTIVDIVPFKIDISSATWNIGKNIWDLEGYSARDEDLPSVFVEKMKANDSLNKSQRQLIAAFEKSHPALADEWKQLIEIPNAENLSNYEVEIEPVYFKSVPENVSDNLSNNTVNYFIDQKMRGKFNFVAFSESESGTLTLNRLIGRVTEDNWTDLATGVIYPNDPSDVNPNNGRKMKSVFFEIKDINNDHYCDFECSFEPLTGIKAKYKWSFILRDLFGNGEYRLWIYLYDLDGNFLLSKMKTFNKHMSASDPISFNLKSLKPVGTVIKPLEGNFRFQVYQDLNSRKESFQEGILIPRSVFPVSYSVSIVAETAIPVFNTAVYTLSSREKYTKISFKDALKREKGIFHLPINEEETQIEFVAYRFTTHDNYTYIDYRKDNGPRKTLKCYDPDAVVTEVAVQEVI